MRRFGDAYREAMEKLPKYHLDAGIIQDELHHRRMINARRHKQLASIAAACIFLMCGAGTAIAVNYRSSVIKVQNGGFSFTGGENMDRAVTESICQSSGAEDGGVGEADAQKADALTGRAAGQYADEAAGRAAGPEAYAAAGPEADPGERDLADSGAYSAGQVQETVQDLEVVTYEPVQYTSIEEFCSQENITMAIPDPEWLGGGVTDINILVYRELGRVILNYNCGEQYFSMSQDDNRGYKGYSSSSVFSGSAENERSFVNAQGLSYTVFDSIEDGEIAATHAAISINGRDLTLGFWDYDRETVEDVLYRLDLNVYFTERG